MRKPQRWARGVGRWVGVGLLSTLTACAPEGVDGPDPSTGESALSGPDVLLRWTVQPLHAVGGIDAPDWAAFGSVVAVGFDDGGRLYLLDSQAKRIVVVGADGEFLRAIGAPGEGPGELRFPAGMVVRPEGTVSVLDVGHRAFVVYAADGTFLRQVRLHPEGGTPEGPLALHDVGIVGTRVTVPSPSDLPPPPHRSVWAWSDASDTPPRELYRGWRPNLPETIEPGPEVTGGLRVMLPPVVAFHPDLLSVPLPGGRLAVADSTGWRVRIVGPEGSVVTALERPISPAAVTGAVREAERSRRLAELEAEPRRMQISNSQGRSAAAPADGVLRLEEARITGMGFHSVIPVVERLAVDREGVIWVQRSSSQPGVPGATDLVTAEGEYLGSLAADGVRIPDAFGPGGLVAAISADDWGVPVVRIGRLHR